MNSGKTCIFDLDDTLGNLREPMQKVLDKYTKKSIPWQNWNQFNITDLYDISLENLFDSIIDSKILSTMEPYENSLKTLTALKDAGHKIVIITSRGYHPEAYDVTKEWFERAGLPYDRIHVSSHTIRKSYYANIYDNVIMAVDDNIENCDDFLNNSKIETTLLMDMPWNVTNADHKRIHDIGQVFEAI